MRTFLTTLLGIGFGLFLLPIAVPLPVQSQEAQPAKKAANTADVEGLSAAAEQFEKAYNAGDAKTIASQFAEDAQVVDEDGNVVDGRANIEAVFAQLFNDYPKAQIQVELTSLRLITPTIAIEDGYSTTTLSPDESSARSPYTIVHMNRDGKWLVVRVRDFPAENATLTTHEQLRSLEWLVGQWVDESREGRVHTTCKWSDDGNYLLQEYVVKSRTGAELRGNQRIAWDPLRRTIRSWAFDNSGGFTEAIWTPLEDGWILRTEGVTPDGQSASVTRRVVQVTDDAYEIASSNMVVGSELIPDATIRVVRVPPDPGH